MEHRHVVHRLLLPADKQPPKAVYPRGDALHNPTAGAATTGSFGGLLIPARFDMRSVATAAGFAADGRRIKPFVATQMLWAARGRSGTAEWKAVERRAEEPLIMHIGAVDRHAQRHAAAVGQHRSLDAQLATVRRVSPGFFPRPREPW